MRNRKEYQKRYYQKNKERLKEYREKNKEKKKIYMEQYRQTPQYKKRKKEYEKEYRLKNKEKLREYYKEFRQKNKERLNEHSRKRYRKYQEQWTQIIKELNGTIECKICGYNKNLACLEFHHKNPEEKEYNVSRIIHYRKPTPERIKLFKTEFEKCDLVCKNCHGEMHHPLLML